MNMNSESQGISYVGYRFPAEVISYAVWLYYRFPLSLRMVEEMMAARGIEVTYETIRRWAIHFGQRIAKRIRSTTMACGDKWHLDEVVITMKGKKYGSVAKIKNLLFLTNSINLETIKFNEL